MADDQFRSREKNLIPRSLLYFQRFGGYPPRSVSGIPSLARRVFEAGAVKLWLREARAHPVLMTGVLALWALALTVIAVQAVR